MKEPRNIEILLKVMYSNQSLLADGLCNLVLRIRAHELITADEKIILLKYIEKNRPSRFSSWDAFVHSGTVYYWSSGKTNPRIKWLIKHIKLNS